MSEGFKKYQINEDVNVKKEATNTRPIAQPINLERCSQVPCYGKSECKLYDSSFLPIGIISLIVMLDSDVTLLFI
jgi:hypothetical protein